MTFPRGERGADRGARVTFVTAGVTFVARADGDGGGESAGLGGGGCGECLAHPEHGRNQVLLVKGLTVLGNASAKAYTTVMAQMNVSIPDKLKGWAESRVAEGRYSSTSDYVRDLVRRDQEGEEARRRLQAAIDEGRASGISERRIADIIADGRKRHRG